MDTEDWNVAEERRVRKLQQIRQLLSIALGPDVDLNQEAKNLISETENTIQILIRFVPLQISDYYTHKDRYPREKPNQIQNVDG